MGNGMCSRRQKRIFQALAFLAAILGFIYGAVVNYDSQNQLQKAEAVALKYHKHQESLSAQLQVLYEHRSRLEKSLHKERLEHKKAKEDFLVYKLEAQETLNKGRQDSNNKYNSLNVQHQMLKSQHDELRKQHSELQGEHQKLGEDLTRTFSDHKEKYLQLQQDKEQELSKLKENVYNLREENKQLRKAHQDVHVQLYDVKNQVEEFMQLKEALNKMSSLRQPEKSTSVSVSEQRMAQPTGTVLEGPTEPDVAHIISEQANVQIQQEAKQELTNQQSRTANEEAVPVNQNRETMDLHNPEEDNGLQQATEQPSEHPVEVEEEHKKELEEEEMEQVGKPERLVEEQDQVQEEQEHHRSSEDDHRLEGHEDDQKEEETNIMHGHDLPERDQTTKTRYKSAYEEQLEQQQLAARRAEDSRRLREQQDSLHQQRIQDILRHQQLQEKDLELQRQKKHKEEQLAEKLRKQAQYDNIDHDIVQGEEEQTVAEDGGAYERDNHHDEAEDLDDANIANEEQALDQQAESKERNEKTAAEDVNPADDPNNQGEDEFEEAEQEREENLPDENEEQRHPHQGHPEVQEHLVVRAISSITG
ncbi:hypothetical protein FKM82_004110 [Ascaphus truei]